jgi:hypothetical protein
MRLQIAHAYAMVEVDPLSAKASPVGSSATDFCGLERGNQSLELGFFFMGRVCLSSATLYRGGPIAGPHSARLQMLSLSERRRGERSCVPQQLDGLSPSNTVASRKVKLSESKRHSCE